VPAIEPRDCPVCGKRMQLRMIVPLDQQRELRIFHCPACGEESRVGATREKKYLDDRRQ
jgi:transcription elongation factor Elf1